MKLYTEEQVRKAMEYYIYTSADFDELFDAESAIISRLTPIELPSDEEIELYLKSFPYTKHLDDGQYNDGVIVGAELAIEWMKHKILNK